MTTSTDRRKRRWSLGQDEVPAFDPDADLCTARMVWVSVGRWKIDAILSVP